MPLRMVSCKRDCRIVGGPSSGSPARARQKLGARRVERLVARQVGRERVQFDQRRVGSAGFGERDRPVQPHDRRRLIDMQRILEKDDLPPIGRNRRLCLHVQG